MVELNRPTLGEVQRRITALEGPGHTEAAAAVHGPPRGMPGSWGASSAPAAWPLMVEAMCSRSWRAAWTRRRASRSGRFNEGWVNAVLRFSMPAGGDRSRSGLAGSGLHVNIMHAKPRRLPVPKPSETRTMLGVRLPTLYTDADGCTRSSADLGQHLIGAGVRAVGPQGAL